MCYQSILGANVDWIVDLPINISDFSGGVKQTLENRTEQNVIKACSSNVPLLNLIKRCKTSI